MGHVTIKTKVIALAVLVVGVIGSHNVSVKGLIQKDTQTQTVRYSSLNSKEILRRDIARDYPVEVECSKTPSIKLFKKKKLQNWQFNRKKKDRES